MNSASSKEQVKRISKSHSNTQTAMDWRRRQNLSLKLVRPNTMIQRLSEREYTACIRSLSCPCCDPNSLQDLNDEMLSL